MATIIFTQENTGAVTSLNSEFILLDRIEGVESSPPASVDVLKLTRRDGQKVIATSLEPRSIVLEGTLRENGSEALRIKLENFKRDVSGSGFLDVTLDGDTTAKRYHVQVTNVIVTNKTAPLTHIPFSVNLTAYDPPFGEGISDISIYSVSNNSSDITQVTDFLGSAEPNLDLQITVDTIGNLDVIEIRNNTTATTLEVEPSAWGAGDILSYKSGEDSLLLNGLPQDFTGVLPKFLPGDNEWEINYRSSSVVIDIEQAVYNSDKFMFGDTWLAQSFVPTGDITAFRTDLLISKTGSPTQISIEIQTDSSGEPSGTVVSGSAANLAGSAVNVLPTYIKFNFPTPVALANATKYWIVVRATGAVSDISNGFYWKGSSANPYASQNASRSTDAGSNWVAASGFDHTFKLYKQPLVASSIDTTTEIYNETFSTTTNRDGAATTAEWNTVQSQLRYNPGSAGTTIAFQQTNAPSVTGLFQDSGAIRLAESIQESLYYTLNQVQFKLAKVGSPTKTLFVEIRNDNSDAPGSTVLATSATVAASSLTTTPTDTAFVFTGGYLLLPNIKYWLTITATDLSQDPSNYVTVSRSNADDYANGKFSQELSTGSWNTIGTIDFYFKATVQLYDSTLNIGQSIALNAANTAYIATVLLNGTEILAPSSSIAYNVQSDSGSGFISVTNGAQSIFTMPNLGATPSHKWKAALSGGTDRSIPILDNLSIAYRKAMPIAATADRLAQSFTPNANSSVASVDLNIAKSVSDTINYTLEIQTDSSGSPSGTIVTNGSATILAANVPLISSGFSWVTAVFSTPPSLTLSTKYWLVLKIGTAGSSKVIWRARGGNSLTGETAKYSTNSGASYITMTDDDFLFRVLSGANTFSNTVDVSYKPRWL